MVEARALRPARVDGPCDPAGRFLQRRQPGARRHAIGGRNSLGGICMIRVLLVDDHAVVRMGFRLLLQSNAEITVIAEADSGGAACWRELELARDAVGMDV